MKIKFKTAVYIGAGNSEFQTLVATTVAAERYVFIKPEQSAMLQLGSNMVLIENGVTPQGGRQRYYHYNLSNFNGFARADELHDLFPNLKLLSNEQIDTRTIDEVVCTLLESGDLKDKYCNYLCIDHPGLSEAVLRTLGESHFELFKQIEICCASQGLFDADTAGKNAANDDHNSNTFEQSLAQHHFEPAIAMLPNTDADFPVYSYSFNLNKLREQNKADALQYQVSKLKSQLKEAREQLALQSKKNDNLRQNSNSVQEKLEKFQHSAKAKREELEAQVIAVKNDLSVQIKAATDNERQLKEACELNAQLSEENKAKQNKINSQELKIEELNKVKDSKVKFEKENAELKYQLEEVTLSFQANRKKLISLQSAYAEMKAVNAQLKSELTVLNEQLEMLRPLKDER